MSKKNRVLGIIGPDIWRSIDGHSSTSSGLKGCGSPHWQMALTNLTDAVARQIQPRSSFWRKPPIQDSRLPFRPQNISNLQRSSRSRGGSSPILNLITAGPYDDVNRS